MTLLNNTPETSVQSTDCIDAFRYLPVNILIDLVDSYKKMALLYFDQDYLFMVRIIEAEIGKRPISSLTVVAA